MSWVTKEFFIVSADRWDVSHLRRLLMWFQNNDIMSSVDKLISGFGQVSHSQSLIIARNDESIIVF